MYIHIYYIYLIKLKYIVYTSGLGLDGSFLNRICPAPENLIQNDSSGLLFWVKRGRVLRVGCFSLVVIRANGEMVQERDI